MGIKNAVLAFVAFFSACGVLFALSGASTTLIQNTRWNGSNAGLQVTEGGNISAVNVASVSLTDKWAAFYGNVTGNVSLTNGTASVYTWTWSSIAGGEVCLSTGSAISGTVGQVSSGVPIDTAWGFPSTSADSANNTFKTADCAMDFSQGSVASTANVTHKGLSSYTTCAVQFGTAQKNNYFFCAAINSTGKSFNNQTVNYEIMVPTTAGAGSETYYFYAELS
jgi:hypothetical protein